MSQSDYIFSDLPNSLLPQTEQVCIVTHDLDACVRGFADRLGIGPWWVKTYAPPELTNLTLRGQPVAMSTQVALAWTGAMNWEIIQPLDGPGPHREYIEAQGEGVHHVACLLSTLGMDWPTCHREFESRGFARLYEGRWQGVTFCYYETLDPTHTTFEVINREEGWQRPDPDYWYPEPPAR